MKINMWKSFVFGIATLLPCWAFSAEPFCMKSLEKDFFRDEYVSQALSLHNVPQGAWMEINRILQYNMRGVPQLIRKRAEKMSPNPLGTPFQWHTSAELMQQVLFEVFFSTLIEFDVIDPGKIREMFNYVREQQMARLVACFGEENIKQHK
jgi:hypothetical protein